MGTDAPPSEDPTPDAPTLPTSGNAIWTHTDCVTFIQHLAAHKAEAGDGGNFKMVTFNGAVVVVNQVRTKGGPKNGKSCASKYAALKKLNQIVEHIKRMSGWSWDSKKGVDVSPATQGTWDAYIAKVPDAARFKNKGWPYSDLFLPLLPVTAKGNHVFRPALASESQDRPAIASDGQEDSQDGYNAPSPEWDLDDFDKDLGGGHSANGGEGGSGAGEGGSRGHDGDEDEDEEDTLAVSSSSPFIGGKRRAAQPSGRQPKKTRLSAGGQALQDLATAATDFNGLMGNFLQAFSTPEPAATAANPATPAPAMVAAAAATAAFQISPQRRTNAIVSAQRELWLSADLRRVFINHISRDMIKVDTGAGQHRYHHFSPSVFRI
ncbi:hypothetical protein C8R44DRAFT_888751 [Mycena epipterygia]|nr:hypothetical protein C8R44DRAFT_888751 [Mycena epipterygia]